MNKIPVVIEEVENDLEKIDRILSIYSVVKNVQLRPFERSVLKYYIKYSYSEEAKEYIKEDYNKTQNQIKTIDSLLRSKGFLKQKENNQRMSELSPDMEVIRNHFILGNQSFYLISFKKWKVE